MAKLFPPSLESKLPAAYWDSEGIHFNIPFQHNEAITDSLYDSFSIKIKTAFTNREVYTFNTANKSNESNGAIHILGSSDFSSYFNVGQFYKV
jgi:hypothetical protein